MNQLDNFFNKKLDGFEKPVPPSAWNRVESNLHKKKNKAFWLKIAAAVSFLAVASTLLFIDRPENHRDELAVQTQKQPSSPASELKPQPDSSATTKPVPPAMVNNEQKKTKSRTIEKIQPVKEETAPAAVPVEQIPFVEVESLDNAIAVVPEEEIDPVSETETREETTEIPTTNAAQNSGVVLVLSAEEVDEKYLNKKSLAKATRDDKRSSTLKKVLNKAYDLKHNQDPLGELRQKKNEILALNFKNEKQRSQNR